MRPVVLVGVPGSGTSLLGARLGAHPAFAMPSSAAWIAGAETMISVRHLVSIFRKTLDEPPADDAWDAGRAFVDLMLARCQAKESGKRLVLNVAQDTAHLDTLLRLLRHAAFLHVCRDPRDVACATRSGPARPTYLADFGSATHLNVVRRWCAWERRIRDAFAVEGAPACLRVAFEELLQEPETCLRRVCGFLEAEYDPAMLAVDDAWLGGIDRWEGELPPHLVAELDRLHGAEIAALGYPRHTAPRSVAAVASAGVSTSGSARVAAPVLRWPFSFAFPAPRREPQMLAYKDVPRGLEQSKVYLINTPPSPAREEELARLVDEGHYFAGICAFETWPARLNNPATLAKPALDLFEKPYYRRFVGFMHNFREPRDVFPDDLPLLRMDFSDYVQVRKRGREKVYDLLCYAGHRSPVGETVASDWGRTVKRHDLAREVIQALLARHADLRVCLVNDDLPLDDPRVEQLGFLPYREFLDKVEQSRIVLVAGELDASPRILTEALCLDTYVMVNERISGGWKYVNPVTGAFFDETNFVEVYEGLRSRGPAATRAWFLRAYPNHVLEQRFNAWLSRCMLAYSAFNGLGRVYFLDAEPGGKGDAMKREIFRFMGIYADCVERIEPAPEVANRHERRARSHLTALRQARELGLPSAAIIEEGFQFIAERRVANRKLGELFEGFPHWDVLLFGNRSVTEREATHEPAVLRVRDARAPCGYAIRAAAFDTLIAALEEGAAAPAGEQIDRAWGRLAKETSCYTFRWALGEGPVPD